MMKHLKSSLVILLNVHRFLVSFGSSLPTSPDCGFDSENHRIIGGQNAALDAYTWLALIEYSRDKDASANVGKVQPNFLCGGSLINSRYVITAAHCKKPETEAISVRLGEHTISTEVDCKTSAVNMVCSEPPQNIPIARFIIHENYVPNVKRKDHRGGQNDIALIKLKHDADFHDFVSPVCLPIEANKGMANLNVNVPKNMVAAGWGVTENGAASDIKQFLEVPLTSFKKCDDAYPTRIISKAQICAGGEQGKDVCSGDSGGPLMELRIEEDKPPFWTLVGIVSYGAKCSQINNTMTRPSVYLNVEKYLDWIESNISNK